MNRSTLGHFSLRSFHGLFSQRIMGKEEMHMVNKIKHGKDSGHPTHTRIGEMESSNSSASPNSAEGKVLQRVSAMEQGETVDWVVIERIQKRGYKVST
jgi:hypothetical protein